MLLSVKQYALLFALVLISLVSVFAYQVNRNLDSTRQIIDNTQKAAAENELAHAIDTTMRNITRSASEISQWQEVRQQIRNPEIFSYWYNVRFKETALGLLKHTEDLMIYDINGEALAELDDNTLPYQINTMGIDTFRFRIISKTDIIYIVPVYDDQQPQRIIGYLSTRLSLLPLMKSLSPFQHIQLDSLALDNIGNRSLIGDLKPTHFVYKLHRAPGVHILEREMRRSIIELALIIAVPTIFLYAFLVIIVGLPIKGIDRYINQLRTEPNTVNDDHYTTKFRVTELKSVYESLNRYHNELSQKEEHLSLMLNSIGDAVIATDSETRVVRMNPVAEHLTGWSFGEARDKSLSEIFHIISATSRQAIREPFNKVTSKGQITLLESDTLLISRDGTEYYIADSAAPIRDPSGQSQGMVLVFSDITEQKMKDEQLQHSLKMDALGKLTGGIAHDFNNLLGVMLGYSELLMACLADDPKQQAYAEQIYNAGERARKLTSKLLTFSRKKSSEASMVDINQLIRSEQHMLEKTLTARVHLVLELDDDIWPLFLDQDQFQDAILNISINAMHAMHEGGTLTVSTRKVHIGDNEKPYIDIRTGDYVLLSISDTGTGMNRETRQKIFDPFFTTKGDAGTGLGMSQVYGFVKQSGGAIHVYSEPGHGTRISIYLPRYQKTDQQRDLQVDSDTLIDAISGSLPGGDESILVVDDEPGLLKLTCQILEQQGYNTCCAGSGAEALQLLEHQQVDLLLSDVIMPDMDGYQLAALVAEKYPRIRIQMVSGFSDDRRKTDEDDRLHRLQLHKPFTREALLKGVRDILDE